MRPASFVNEYLKLPERCAGASWVQALEPHASEQFLSTSNWRYGREAQIPVLPEKLGLQSCCFCQGAKRLSGLNRPKHKQGHGAHFTKERDHVSMAAWPQTSSHSLIISTRTPGKGLEERGQESGRKRGRERCQCLQDT